MICIVSSPFTSVALSMKRARWDTKNKESPLRASPGRKRHLVVPEGIPSQIVVQAYCTTSGFDLYDLTDFCLKYRLFFLSLLLNEDNVGRVPFHFWWCAAGAWGIVV